MMNTRLRTAGRRFALTGAAAFAALAFALGGALPASAATGVSVATDTGSASGYNTDVSVQGTVAGGSYTLGLCSEAVFGTRPACTYLQDFTGTGGTVTLTDVYLEATFTNAHSGGTQPATYTCDAATGADGPCQVVAVLHSPPYSFVADRVTFVEP